MLRSTIKLRVSQACRVCRGAHSHAQSHALAPLCAERSPNGICPFRVAGFFDEISMHVQDFCRFDIVLPAVMFLTAEIVPFSHIAKPLIPSPARPRIGALESVSLGSSSLDSLEGFLQGLSACGFCHGNLRVEIHFANLIVVWILSNSRRIVYWSLLLLR